ncbi:hypothetical protein TWF481_008838 [Arthrobotrys musiformis]|uniref:Heterokaryon incompatibility domain-containing protein n=1 Tax=Arthrobotrys musiformis TaxID=47236 RepID=A0AAV9W8C6_9PEZI
MSNNSNNQPPSTQAIPRLPYLNFRAPGNRIAQERVDQLQKEIQKQKEILERLEESWRAVCDKSRKELTDVVLSEPPVEGSSNDVSNIDSISNDFQKHLKEVTVELKAAIAQTPDVTTYKEDGLRDSIASLEEGLGWERRNYKIYTEEIEKLNKESKDLKEALAELKCKRDDEADPQALEKSKNHRAETNGQGAQYIDVEGLENGVNGNNTDGDDSGDDDEAVGDDERGEGDRNTPRDTGERGAEGHIEWQLQLEEPGFRSKQKTARESLKERIKNLEQRIDYQSEKIGETEVKKRKAQQEIDSLDAKRLKIEKQINDFKKMDLDRDSEETGPGGQSMEREARRERQFVRKESLEALREVWARDQYFGRRGLRYNYVPYDRFGNRSGSDRERKIEKLKRLEQVEKILRSIQDLEKTFNNVVEASEAKEEVRNLIDVLEWEIDIENRTTGAVQGPRTDPSKSTGHLSGGLPKYKELESGHIRLLKIWPAPANHYPLICSLTHRSLRATETDYPPAQKYVALSYFWGPDQPNAYIYLREDDEGQEKPKDTNWGGIVKRAKRVRVRLNLFRALLRLRASREHTFMWVDYLCIDQKNRVEKTAQLREMVKIYRKAEKVCVWLGEPDEGQRSDQAMDFIGAVKDFAMLGTYVEDGRRAIQWYGISELMRDRWFSRRWVVQEIALAKKATIHCGSRTVEWSDFVDAVSILVSNRTKIRCLFDSREWRDGPDTLGEVQSFGASTLIAELGSLFWRAEDGTIIKPVKSLESLVTSLKTFDTSDERDIIYSLIFIASDTWRGDPGPTAGYTKKMIDYDRTIADVYKEFIQFSIESAKSVPGCALDIICRPWALPIKNRAEGQPPLPSWICLLSNSVFGEPEHVYKGRKNGETFVGSTGQSRYRASGDKEHTARFHDWKKLNSEVSSHTTNGVGSDENSLGGSPEAATSLAFPWSLVVSGFTLAKVSKVSPKSTGGLILQESLQMGGWSGIESADLKGDGKYVFEKIWRTLVANKDTRGGVPPTWYQRACLRCLEMADNFNGGDLNVGQLLQGASGMMENYLSRVQSTIWNRSFFTASAAKRPEFRLSRAKTRNDLTVPESTPDMMSDSAQDDEIEGDKKYFEMKEIYGDKGNDFNDGRSELAELFGLCSGNTLPDDLVCIIYGCSVPVILRLVSPGPLDERFMIVGEAYVHGKMDGEAMDSFDAGLALGKEQEFHLV